MKAKNRLIEVSLLFTFCVVISFPVFIRFSLDSTVEIFNNCMHNLVYSFSCWYTFKWLLDKSNNKINYFLICLLLGTVFIILLDFIGLEQAMPIQRLDRTSGILFLLFRGLLVGGLLSFIVYYLKVVSEKQKNAIELEQLKQKQLEASLSSLKEQLSPHFLFNSLNTLKSLIRQNPDASEDFVVKLSEVYRFLLTHSEKTTVSIDEELEFVNAYIYLLENRFGENIHFNIQIPQYIRKKLIPPLTLQLLIENAVKHNIISKANPLFVIIEVEKSMLKVSNNYQPKTTTEGSRKVGLSSIHKRYQYLCNSGIQILRENHKFIVKVPILD